MSGRIHKKKKRSNLSSFELRIRRLRSIEKQVVQARIEAQNGELTSAVSRLQKLEGKIRNKILAEQELDRKTFGGRKPNRKAKKTNVHWTCKECGRVNRWRWSKEDLETQGTIIMECDKCRGETKCVGDGNGNFYACTC